MEKDDYEKQEEEVKENPEKRLVKETKYEWEGPDL